MVKKEIFRSVALARMSSPEQLDKLLRVTTPRSWIALAAVGVILLTAVVWGFEGRLATKTGGKGVAIRTGNLLTVNTLGTGQVVRVTVNVGDRVKQGQVIATVGQPLVADKIRVAEAQLTDAETERQRQAQVRTAGLGLEEQSVEGQRASLDQQIKALEEQAKVVADQIPVNEELLAKGLITKQQILALRERQMGIANNITSLRTEIVRLNATRFRNTQGGKQSEVDYQSRITDLQRNLRLLRGELDMTSKVVSPYSGQVVEIQTVAGSLVGAGAPILTLEPESDSLEIVAYVPSAKAKEVHPNMPAEIIPSSVRVEEYGFIRGKVTSVSEYPTTDAALTRTFQNSSLSQALAAGGPVNEVRIAMLSNPSTPSGFQWSSKSGAPVKITPATLCSVQIVTREEPPIDMVFPYIKEKLGLY
ncbi:MAG: NHLP bacteriocin system secretion protein [Bryobacteraceae bacterium]